MELMETHDTILKKTKENINELLTKTIHPSISELITIKLKEECDKFIEITNNEIKNNINSSICDLIDVGIKKEKENYLKKFNVIRSVFPKPIGSGLFRYCGKCCLCRGTPDEKKNGLMEEYNKLNCKISELKGDEYFFICSGLCVGGNRYGEGMRGLIEVSEYNDSKGLHHINYYPSKSCSEIFMTNYGSIIQLYITMRGLGDPFIIRRGCHPITQNSITIINNNIIKKLYSDFYKNDGNFSADIVGVLKNFIVEYDSLIPSWTELYIIEKQKDTLENMTIELQKRETILVKDKKELEEKTKDLYSEKENFEEEKKIHKQKSKNLLKRENSIFLKESIQSAHQELKDISYSLSEIIDLFDDVDPIIEKRLNQTIKQLNKINNEEEEVIQAYEINN